MKASEIRWALERLCAAFNAHDLDGVMTFFAEDCVLEMPEAISRGERVTRAKIASGKLSRGGSRDFQMSTTETSSISWMSARVWEYRSGC